MNITTARKNIVKDAIQLRDRTCGSNRPSHIPDYQVFHLETKTFVRIQGINAWNSEQCVIVNSPELGNYKCFIGKNIGKPFPMEGHTI